MEYAVDDIFEKPSFFKVLLEDFSHKLRVPPAFLKHIQHYVRRKVILKGPSNIPCTVKIKWKGNDMYFHHGWEECVAKNCMEETDFLVFTYLGGKNFSILVFDRTGCEAERVPSNGVSENNETMRITYPRGRPRRFITADQQGSTTRAPTKNKKGGHAEYENNVTIRNRKRKRTACEVQRTSEENRRRSYYISSRKPVTEVERAKAWKKAQAFKSKNPCVIIQLIPSAVYSAFVVHLPFWFSTNYLPRENTAISLEAPDGKIWEVSYIVNNKEKRDSLSGGWKDFSLTYNLEEGDICIFEVVSELELKIHFYRIVKHITLLKKGWKQNGLIRK